MILGNLIKEYRKKYNLSMNDMAKKSGLSKAYISILEKNYNPTSKKAPVPSLETIKAVATAIHMDFNDVISMLDNNRRTNALGKEKHTNEDIVTPEKQALFNLFDTLDEESKKRMLAMIRAYVAEMNK
jgi:transcriptional regulator with XRE-family HTH domain